MGERTYQSFYSFMNIEHIGCQLQNIWNIKWIFNEQILFFFCSAIVVVVIVIVSLLLYPHTKKWTIFPSVSPLSIVTGWPDTDTTSVWHTLKSKNIFDIFNLNTFEAMPSSESKAYIRIRIDWWMFDCITERNKFHVPLESGFISCATVNSGMWQQRTVATLSTHTFWCDGDGAQCTWRLVHKSMAFDI